MKENKKINLPLKLLSDKYAKPDPGDVDKNIKTIKWVLEKNKIQVKMGKPMVGPTTTLYPFTPEPDVNLNKLARLLKQAVNQC